MRFLLFVLLIFSSSVFAQPALSGVKGIERVFIVMLENTDAAPAQKQPFLKSLMNKGAYLADFHALAHPSLPNYIGLVAGDILGIKDDAMYDLDAPHIGDLLDAKKRTWKAYAEDFPGGCFKGAFKGAYARKHNPFMSFKSLTTNPERCKKHVVPASELDQDIARGTLPDYAMFVPNQRNDGHDTSIKFADAYMARVFGPYLKDPRFAKGTLFVVTFDENDGRNDIDGNLIATFIVGPGVKNGFVSRLRYDHYSLVRTVEELLGIGSLNKQDLTASIIDDIWNATPTSLR